MSPAPLVEEAEEEYDFSVLDPANLMKQVVGEQTEIPQQETPDPVGDLLAKQTLETPPAPVTPVEVVEPPAPAGKPEGVNFRQLREARGAAERERDQLKTERDALAAKLADLEPRAAGYETERADLTRQLEEIKAAHTDAQAAVRRLDARRTPEWEEKAQMIRTAAESVKAILDMPAVKEAGVMHDVGTLLNPSARAALNETIRVLQENGHYAEAQELIDSNRAVNAWRGELRRIEDGAAEEAKTWQANREASAMGVVRSVREQIAQANPIHNVRSPEFMALGKEQQDFLLAQHTAAEAAARAVLDHTTKPEALVAQTYRDKLAFNLMNQHAQGQAHQLAAAQKELAEVKARLATYEKAAGGGSGPSGGGGQASPSDDPEEVAKMLDPRNMRGYRGVV